MKKLIILLLIMMFLLTACSVKQEETADFAVPTPAVEEAEPTPTPEPIPTEKPYSEYNENLKNTSVGYVTEPNVGGFGKSTLSGVENASELIVLATVMEKKQTETWDDIGFCDTDTTAKLKIEKVFKGDIAEGDELMICELAYILAKDYESGYALASISGRYFPSWEHRSYLFFLDAITQAPAEYTPVDRWHGKYPVSPAAKEAYETGNLTCEALELSNPNGNSDVPRNIASIFREAYEKYYPDEAVQEIIEREAEYQKHYGE